MDETPSGSQLRNLACVDIQVDLSASLGSEQQRKTDEKVRLF